MNYIEWQEQGYHLLLVEAKSQRFNLFVSADGESYAIYDRFSADNLAKARAQIGFSPAAFELVPPPFPISRDRAIRGETGIPAFIEPLVRRMEASIWS